MYLLTKYTYSISTLTYTLCPVIGSHFVVKFATKWNRSDVIKSIEVYLYNQRTWSLRPELCAVIFALILVYICCRLMPAMRQSVWHMPITVPLCNLRAEQNVCEPATYRRPKYINTKKGKSVLSIHVHCIPVYMHLVIITSDIECRLHSSIEWGYVSKNRVAYIEVANVPNFVIGKLNWNA